MSCFSVYFTLTFFFSLVEIATLTRKDGKSVIRILPKKDIDQEIKEHEEREKEREAQEAAKRMTQT